MLNTKEYVFIVLSNVLLEEIRKVSTAEAILKAIGNGKPRNSELESSLNMSTSLVAANIAGLMRLSISAKIHCFWNGFIARQFAGTVREYFIERIRKGPDLDTEEVGTC